MDWDWPDEDELDEHGNPVRLKHDRDEHGDGEEYCCYPDVECSLAPDDSIEGVISSPLQ